MRVVVVALWDAEGMLGQMVARNVLRWPSPGDRPYSDFLPPFAFEVVLAILAIVVATVWTVLDPHRREYRRLSAWLYAFVRFALAVEMIAYGLSKIFPEQFGGRVNLVALVTPLGILNPQGLLWAFMGFSRPYTIFVGIGELVGALMMCFRRTATVGALLLVAILANVFVMNLAYDVEVKVTSANLLAMALLVGSRALLGRHAWRRSSASRP